MWEREVGKGLLLVDGSEPGRERWEGKSVPGKGTRGREVFGMSGPVGIEQGWRGLGSLPQVPCGLSDAQLLCLCLSGPQGSA